ncbi:MAG TPA: hypothetical protein VGR62_03595 [Candidatus Binatia bacterium]|jgi:hypothetical protein|nr:hypothetical protein [Candidatus Binatia bacterium]
MGKPQLYVLLPIVAGTPRYMNIALRAPSVVAPLHDDEEDHDDAGA